jgi:hypothetical protein
MGNDTYSITLGFEDLLVMLRVLGIRQLFGMPEDPMAGVPAEQANASLAAAERSLRARGFLQVNDDQERIIVYSPVAAMILTCALAPSVLRVFATAGGGLQTLRYYYASSDMAVEHSFPERGLNRFTAAPTFQHLSGRLFDLLKIGQQPQPADASGTTTEASLQRARDLARADQQSAASALQKGGLTEATALRIGRALGHALCTATVSAAYTNENIPVQGLALIVEESAIWGVVSGQQEGTAQVLPLSGQEAASRILAMLEAGRMAEERGTKIAQQVGQ